MSAIAVLIPTFNNPQYLYPCVESILRHTASEDLVQIYLINNGKAADMEPFKQVRYCTILQQEKNLGWEGGLKAGLAASKEPYVLLMNDDTYVPYNQRLWLHRMLSHFSYPDIGAVGPTSNVVMGKQQMFYSVSESFLRTKFLIGFCMLLKREILDAVGGIDDLLPGGDDLDLSIRLRKAGKALICDREVFVWHHGFKTGERVEGGPSVVGGWNSLEKLERTNWALIKKHGLREFLDLWKDEPTPSTMIPHNWGDPENEIVKRFVIGDKVAELGCGNKKVVPNSVGIDAAACGNEIPGLTKGVTSIADVTANVEEPLPIKDFDTIIAQHVLEHTVDAVGSLNVWKEALRHGGRLIIAVPDQSKRNTIPMNWEHRHCWTPASLKKMMETLGMKTIDMLDPQNGVSFVGVFERNGNGLQ